MPWDEEDEQQIFDVVVNHEEQYSIWPAERDIPGGWRAVGTRGPKKDCLAYIEQVWTDMRPLSLRQTMDGTSPAQKPPDRGSEEIGG